MRVTDKGQVTIPKALRDKFGIGPGAEIEFIADETGIIIKRISEPRPDVRALVERAWGSADTGLSTDEIMALTRGDE
jgi:AbrB family looped-hinge helix DNA binding protein